MPVGELEGYDFSYDSNKGVELKFYSLQLSGNEISYLQIDNNYGIRYGI